MALQKSFTTTYGIPATYWKFGPLKTNFHTKQCVATMIGFVNQQARTDGMDPIKTKEYSFKDTNFTFDITQPLVAQLYAKVKVLEEWSGATDV
jgi:hypothetical protein